MRRSDFPPGFVFGTATASYQVEGAVNEGGRGETIWDRFAHMPGAIADGSNGDVACDHHRLWREDVALMKHLGFRAYRFSIAWSRILPEGRGTANTAGIAFYDRLVDGLLEAGIAPAVTLYHWDLPQALQDRGGFTNPDVAKWFRDYAAIVFRALGDRVPHWMTLNEPWCIAVLGHFTGVHAPGIRDLRQTLRVCKNLMLAHGEAVSAFRDSKNIGKIGIVLNASVHRPATDSPEDRAAAERSEALSNFAFSDPIFLGEWPRVLVDHFGDPPEWRTSAAEWMTIRSPIDFVGMNYYMRVTTSASSEGALLGTKGVRVADVPRTAMDWEVYPDGMREVLVRTAKRYGSPPMYVTENGAAYDDVPDDAGFVDDAERTRFIIEHLEAGRRAIAEGVDLRGWFFWSLLDNFEWAEGYRKRFGIVRVDYDTQKRTPKASAHVLARLLAGEST